MNQEAEHLFHELADLSAEEREDYYRRLQVPDEVRTEVEDLLRFDDGAEHTLTELIAGSAHRSLNISTVVVGARCGPYLLTKLLGRGGMGTVYLGERADGEVQQRAAIKLLRYAGDEPSFRDRFLRERQILATLNHSGVARLLDAGHTADGEPYLAMDYIEGTPIDVYAKDLDIRARLRLFLDVCDAVSYAHRNLIIHRDIKPSNILINHAGEPKLLDFGIAKLLDASLDTQQTRTRDHLLTPDYASPEQVRGEAQTVATDIYSLGAVLYKLLTGRSPHAFSGESKGGIEAAVCNRDPLPPSSFEKEIPKDLDYILGKALRKEPGERYPSVDAFADDVRSFLEWRPVRARSGNAWYRTRKFLRRYRVAATAAALTLAGLSIGLFVANRERMIAERRFQEVRQIANKALALDNDIRNLPGTTKVRQEIVAMSQEYLAGLSPETRGDRQLALEVAQAYLRLARIQGVPNESNLGQYAEAETSLKKAVALLDPILKASPRNKNALIAAAESEQDLMILADTTHRNNEALAHAANAAARVETFLQTGPLSTAETNFAARILSNVALMNKNKHFYSDSIRYARRAADLARDGPNTDAMAPNALSVLADSLRLSGDLDGALQAIEEARARVERTTFPGEMLRRSSLFNVFWREGIILGQDGSISLDRTADAIVALTRAFDTMELSAVQDQNDSRARLLEADAAAELGPLINRSDPKRALAIYEKTLSRLREIKNNARALQREALILARSSYPLRRIGEAHEARQRIDTAVLLLRKINLYPEDRMDPSSDAATVDAALGDHFAETKQPEQAAETYQHLLDKVTAFHPDVANDLGNAIQMSRIYQALAALDRQIGKPDRADALDASRRQLWQGWSRKLPGNPFVMHQL